MTIQAAGSNERLQDAKGSQTLQKYLDGPTWAGLSLILAALFVVVESGKQAQCLLGELQVNYGGGCMSWRFMQR